MERDKERRRLHNHCTIQAMASDFAAQKHLALRDGFPTIKVGVPSLGHCGVAPRPCATVGTPSASLVNPMTRGPVSCLVLTLNPGFQIDNFILLQPHKQPIENLPSHYPFDYRRCSGEYPLYLLRIERTRPPGYPCDRTTAGSGGKSPGRGARSRPGGPAHSRFKASN